MNKKTRNIIIIIASVLLVAAVATVGILFMMKQRNSVNVNKANVEWYDENGTEFVISTAEELYGVAALSEYYDFKGQTIKLGADIVVNEGSASDWAKKGPKNRWYPITGFAGTFDGQGHSISGLYAKGSNVNLGLFAETMSSCDIRDFKIVNSYFRVNGNFAIGSVSANGSGKFSNIYSDAILTSNGSYCGGLFGSLNVGGGSAALGQTSKITNCWFDGEVILTTKEGRYGGGIAGSLRGGITEISHCLNTGHISSESNSDQGCRVGGIVGGIDYVNGGGTLRMEDCLNAGPVETVTPSQAGSVIGTVAGSAIQVSLRNVYATVESCARTLGYCTADAAGAVRMLSAENVKGTDWYRWSTLDFDSHWAAVSGGTPILMCFADDVPSVDGIEKAYDISWYSDDASDFELTTKEELIGFSILSTDYTFEGKTVYLGADIVFNEGKSEDWLKKTPNYIWTPIGSGLGSSVAFSGNFDGQGHTISGLYTRSSETGIGLFRSIGPNSKVKNVRITNSYLEYIGDNEMNANLGSIAGRCYGNLDTIYSDATLVSTGLSNGGMVGQISTGGFCTINNCWYDGTLTMTGDTSKGGRMGGGIVGRIESGKTTISHCLVSGDISSEAQKVGVHVGGFVGYIRYSKENEGVKLDIKDSLMAGTLKTIWNNCVGTIIGRVFEQVTVNMSETYAVQGNCVIQTEDNITKANAVGRIDETGVVNGGCINKSKKQLTGYNGYIWTILDFDNYWTVVLAGNGQKAGTPVLKSFAEKTPSLSGVARMIDIKWYDEAKKSYTITNVKQLLGLAELAGGTVNFLGKTVKLGADITVNSGEATAWKKEEPAYVWLPIGAGINANQGFCGTFDGQGHTISGLYYKNDETGIGLFKAVGKEGLVKNIRLTNSYFEYNGKDRSTAAIGGIVGRSYGNLDTVYSNAIVQSTGLGNGGLVGQIYGDKNTVINNCWFDGTLAMVGAHADGGQHGGGIVGRIERGAVSINHCLTTGLVSCEATETGVHAGGLVGYIRYEKKDDGTKLNISDCLVAGKVEVAWHSCAGSVVGRVFADVTANIEKTYVLEKNCIITKEGKVSYGNTVGFPEGTVNGGAVSKTKEQLSGNNGYIFSELNFDKYWAVASESTPVLQSFAGVVPSVAGLPKLVDTSWYDAKKNSYTISTVAQLYGFADMVGGIDEFKGKTVKLGADITVNSGTVAEWEQNEFQNLYKWVPIGNVAFAFRGNFDGQGHTISGLYMDGNGSQALFGKAYGDNIAIKNFSLKNTYIKSTAANNGSIAGVFRGNMERIYSDAKIVVAGADDTKRYATGGMVGYIDTHDTKFSECWFAGNIQSNGQALGGIFGVQYNSQVTTIENCLVTGTIATSTSLANQVMGGFVGSIHGNWVGSNLKPKLVVKTSVFEGTLNAAKVGANMAGLLVGQVSTKNAEGGIWLTNSYFAPSGNWGVVGWQAEKAVVTDNNGKTTYTGSCAALNTNYRKERSAISVLNTKLGLSSSIWCDVLQGTVLTAFADGYERIDTAWYDKNADTYTLTNRAQLYGLARLNESAADVFAGKTILLGEDITVNSGAVATWKEESFEGLLKWEPIGSTNAFRGNFNGQGHDIIGLYMNGNGTQALFAKAYGKDDAVINIGNFDLKNTYIKSTGGNNGSIVGIFRGNMTSVYSDATIDIEYAKTSYTDNVSTGGMIGYVDSKDTTIANCWYAGNLTTNAACAGGLVGNYSTSVVLTIENCLVSGTLTTNIPTKASGLTNAGLGGFIGKIYGSAKTLNVTKSFCIGNVVQGAKTAEGDKNRSHIGQFFGQIRDGKCNVTVADSYGVTGRGGICGWVDGGIINGTTVSGGNGGLNSSCVKTIDSLKVSNTSLKLNTNVWKDTSDGLALLLNDNEAGMVRIDITWYVPNSTTYTLTTKEQLYGLAYLNNHRDTVFRGKTVTLGADIKVNDGTVTEWKANNFANLIKWEPVGTTYAFRGSFNGNGHTISGIYMNGAGNQSLFGKAYDNNITIQDFALVNSYIKSTGGNNGSVASVFRGNIISVYSATEINVDKASKDSQSTGGMIGYVDSATTIANCWYAGDLTTNAPCAGGLVGYYGAACKLTIENCLVSGTLTTQIPANIGTNDDALGGFIGRIINSNNKTLELKNSLFTGTLVEAIDDSPYVGEFIGRVHNGAAQQCSISVVNAYFPEAHGTGWAIGYVDGNSIIINDVTKATDKSASASAYANATLRGLCKKAISASTVEGLKLNTNAWKDTDNGPILLKFEKFVTNN